MLKVANSLKGVMLGAVQQKELKVEHAQLGVTGPYSVFGSFALQSLALLCKADLPVQVKFLPQAKQFS